MRCYQQAKKRKSGKKEGLFAVWLALAFTISNQASNGLAGAAGAA